MSGMHRARQNGTLGPGSTSCPDIRGDFCKVTVTNGETVNHHHSPSTPRQRRSSPADRRRTRVSLLESRRGPRLVRCGRQQKMDSASRPQRRSNNSWRNCPIHLHKTLPRLAIPYAPPRPSDPPAGPFSRAAGRQSARLAATTNQSLRYILDRPITSCRTSGRADRVYVRRCSQRLPTVYLLTKRWPRGRMWDAMVPKLRPAVERLGTYICSGQGGLVGGGGGWLRIRRASYVLRRSAAIGWRFPVHQNGGF